MTIVTANYSRTVEGIRTALSTPTLPITLFIGVFGLIIAYYRYRIHQVVHDTYRNYDKAVEAGTKYHRGDMGTNPNDHSSQLRSIQDFNKSYKDVCGTSNNMSHEGKGNRNQSQRQFYNSTYYYAHNKYKRGGGYSDGLEAEDYTMNGPRLLSKNGIPVMAGKINNDSGCVEGSAYSCSNSVHDSDGKNRTFTDDCNDRTNAGESASLEVQKIAATTRPSQEMTKVTIPITKYLWEDTDTISKIRIESLPMTVRHVDGTSEQTTTTIPWSQANIPRSNIHIRIRQDRQGFVLLLKRQQSSQEVDETHYLLQISNLYGRIDAATTVWKSNRLLVKLIKSDGYKSIWPSISSAGAYSNTIQETPLNSENCITRDKNRNSCLIM
jgi:hypothetical protein